MNRKQVFGLEMKEQKSVRKYSLVKTKHFSSMFHIKNPSQSILSKLLHSEI